MHRGLIVSIGLAAPIVVGCATMTPEQAARRDLLLRAAQECQQRYQTSIVRFEFDRFDRLLWFYREGTSPTVREQFSTCYNERVTELTRIAASSQMSGSQIQPTPSAGAGGVSGGPNVGDAWREAPVWKVGDEWSYRWESPRGGGTFVWRVSGEESVNGTDCYIIDSGRYQLYVRKSDLAFVQQKDRGVLEYRYVPPRQYTVWPLQVGQGWELLFVQERPQDRSTSNLLRTWRVESRERIIVPAGTFDAFKVTERDKWTGRPTLESWLAPEPRGYARVLIYWTYGVEKRELTAFKLN